MAARCLALTVVGCVIALAGCRQIFGLDSPAIVSDAADSDSMFEDAPTCPTCAFGCGATPPACARLVPAGGGALPTDLDPDAQLVAVTFGATTIDTSTGEIVGVRLAGSGIESGIRYTIRNNIAVFVFASLTIDGPVTITGRSPVVLVSLSGIVVDDAIFANGGCSASTGGPGGGRGGAPGIAATGPGGGGAGTGGADDSSGGGGGGHGALGGVGGKSDSTTNTPGGAAFGDLEVTTLQGGGGGGGGGGAGSGGGGGGGGGGGVQLVANGTISVRAAINAGGCGGQGGPPTESAGGGGAGGTILLEASVVELSATAVLAVNGGGGGGSDGGATGSDGLASSTRAPGGTVTNLVEDAEGGPGGAGTALAGGPGENDTSAAQSGGGGGGAVGRIRINTVSGAATIALDAVLSPPLVAGTTSQGMVATD